MFMRSAALPAGKLLQVNMQKTKQKGDKDALSDSSDEHEAMSSEPQSRWCANPVVPSRWNIFDAPVRQCMHDIVWLFSAFLLLVAM